MQGAGSGSQGIGEPVRRKEDFRLLTGRGRFVDDVRPPRLAHAVLVRSPHAHARILTIDTAAALAAPGVLAVLTGADCRADGLAPLPHAAGLMGPPDIAVRQPGGPMVTTRHDALPVDTVRFVGEPIAFVVADTIDQAKDAAELVAVAYEALPAVALAADAVAPGAPHLWQEAPDNVCVEIEAGDEAATADGFAQASHIVRLQTRIQRVTGVPMEPRTVIGEYDTASGLLHAALGQRPRGQQAAHRSGAGAGGRAGAGARCVRRHGRQFRHAQFLLPRICAAALGGAPHRPAGQVDLRARRGFPERLPGPRPHRRGRAGT